VTHPLESMSISAAPAGTFRRGRHGPGRVAGALAVLLLAAASAAAQAPAPLLPESIASAADAPAGDKPAAPQGGNKKILDMDIDQLSKVSVGSSAADKGAAPSMNTEVSSVSKQESTVGKSAAAVFVITQEMIRRSGATNIPDLLRMVPGLDVARINSSSWSVTSRGFAGFFTGKLLVLIDGRSVYDPTTTGVHWDVQDVLLEDIERIEVVRGPGGTLWGANAVNGVISIITKKAKDTHGGLLSAGGGSHDLTINGFRYGNQVGEGLHWRVYGKQFERGPGFDPATSGDDWRMGRGGFRVDWDPDPHRSDMLTIQGDYYGGRAGQQEFVPNTTPPVFGTLFAEAIPLDGQNVLGRWTHTFDEDSNWTLQMYYDRAYRDQSVFREEVNTWDVDFQHRFPVGARQHVIWGCGHRQVSDTLEGNGFDVTITPPQRTTGVFSAFVQDEITLREDLWYFTVGSKFEHNDFSGFEYQPSGRLLFTPDAKHSLWRATARATRRGSYPPGTCRAAGSST